MRPPIKKKQFDLSESVSVTGLFSSHLLHICFHSSKLDWEGVCGTAPDSGQLEEAVATKDLYM